MWPYSIDGDNDDDNINMENSKGAKVLMFHYAPCNEDMRKSGDITPCILNLATR
jgi:hypothetical protein